jgi:phage major head subunit gpT-like protein
MAVNTSAIASLLRPGLAAIFGSYNSYPAQWKEIYEVYQSDKGYEQEVQLKMLGLAQIRAEGAATAMDSIGERIKATYIHKTLGLGIIITKQAISDNLYKTRFPMQAKALRTSMAQTEEVLAASVINNGFNNAYPIGDGQPLFSQNHPIDAGVVANTPAVQADLNEASLESAIIAIQKFRDQAGLITMLKPQKLLVPAENQFVANRLLGSVYRTSTGDNDISAVYNMSAVPQGYKVNQFITLPNMWMLMTDCPDGFKKYDRWPLETDVYTDFDTDSVKCKATQRYSFGVSDFRAAYASSGA